MGLGGLEWLLRVACIVRLGLLVVNGRVVCKGLLQLAGSLECLVLLHAGVVAGFRGSICPKSISICVFGSLSGFGFLFGVCAGEADQWP